MSFMFPIESVCPFQEHCNLENVQFFNFFFFPTREHEFSNQLQ